MLSRLRPFIGRIAGLLTLGVLASCQTEIPKDLQPLATEMVQLIQSIGSTATAPIFMRVFKEESTLEVWKQRSDGQYVLLKSYEICAWSGELGPKLAEGDRQAPEGFYTVGPAQMNPDSSYYLSFNIGYPNTYDRALGRTGAHLMVHGACSSAGCYSMTDQHIAEIYALAREAFRGGQRTFEVHAFPFRMTAQNMARHHDNPNFAFWEMLKTGYDHFEVTHRPPQVAVCDFGYVFNAEAAQPFVANAVCPAYQVPPAIATAVAARQQADAEAFRLALARIELEARIAQAPVSGPVSTPLTTGSIGPTAAPSAVPQPMPAPVGRFQGAFGQ